MSESDKKIEPQKAAHERMLQKLLSLRFVGLVIAIGIIVISVSKFVDSVSSLIEALPNPDATISAFDTRTQEQTLNVAREIDNLCSSLIESGTIPYAHFAETYRTIDVELQNLLLRQESRPLNTLSVEQQRLVIENFAMLIDNHKSSGEVSKVFVTEVRKLFHQMFKQILYLEASKPRKET